MPADPPDARRLADLRRRLLAWYRKARRNLPWRADPAEAYHALVSEAMLQQTQVATVVPYFERFVARWPTVADLAAADEQGVLAMWQGLGYYRRARNLHAAAKVIVNQFEGNVPDNVDALLKLPGVGRYTAGAIASIAFDTPAPILDGNVMRVFARWFNVDESIDDRATQQHFWSIAQAFVTQHTRSQKPGDINQSLMELGALVCTPKSPSCLMCPVAALCDANDAGTQADLPRRAERRQPKAVRHRVVVIQRRGMHLFEQRPTTGLWSNMWQLPTAESLDGDEAAIGEWIASHTGLTAAGLQRDHDFAHQTTHRSITFEVWTATAVTGRLRAGFGGTWRSLDRISDLPLPNPQRRIVDHLRDTTT